MTVTVGEWLGIGGFGLTLAVTLAGVIRWAVKRETEYIRRDELERMEVRLKAELGKVASDGQVERDRLENRVNQRVNQLDAHVETMTAMWVSKGKD